MIARQGGNNDGAETEVGLVLEGGRFIPRIAHD